MQNDILDIDLSTADTSFPVISGGIYAFRVADIEVKSNEARTIAVTLETTEPTQSTQGDSLEAGQKVFGNVNTAPTGKAKAETIKRGVAEFVQAFGSFVTGWSGRDLLTRHKELIGQVIHARADIQPAGPDKTGTYRKARNIVAEWIKP